MDEPSSVFDEFQEMQRKIITETGQRLQAKLDKIISDSGNEPVILVLTREQAVFLLDQLRPAMIARNHVKFDVSEIAKNSELPDVYKRMIVSVYSIIDHLVAATGWEDDE